MGDGEPLKPDTKTNSRTRAAAVAIITAIFVLSAFPMISAQETVDLGTADAFGILAGSAVTNTGPSVINGNIGVHPGTSVTGFEEATVNGEIHIADEVADQAKVDLTNAYNGAAGQSPATMLATELGDQVLTPGVYDSESGTFGLTGSLTLDAQSDPDSVWIFQMKSTLITASDSSVVLVNGAQACNLFWQVGSSATLGARTDFKGNILAQAAITMNNAATLDGRALARTEAVTLDDNVITVAQCASADDPPTDDPPTDDPPTDDPPTDDPPTDDPVEEQQPPACPENLAAQAHGNEDISLSWDASADAHSYHVYRATGDGAMEHMAEVTSTNYTDTDTEAKTTYTYEVIAANEAGESEDCGPVEVTTIPVFSTVFAALAAGILGIGAYALIRRRT